MIIQTNHFTCDACGITAETREETTAYDDPVVGYPPGWSYAANPADRGSVDFCPACLRIIGIIFCNEAG